MTEDHRRHDISDRAWELLEPHLPGRRGACGRVAKDNRRFYVREHLGEIYRQIMVAGRIRTAVSAAGGTKEYGKSDSSYLSKTLILNGS